MLEFLKWFLTQHMKVENSELYLNMFKNFITLVIISLFAVQVLRGVVITNDFWLLLGMILGFYFNDKVNSGKKD